MIKHKHAPLIKRQHQFSSAGRSDYGFHNELFIACRFTYSVHISGSNIPLRTCLSCVFTEKVNFDSSLLPPAPQPPNPSAFCHTPLRVRARWEPAYHFWHWTNYNKAFDEIDKICRPIVFFEDRPRVGFEIVSFMACERVYIKLYPIHPAMPDRTFSKAIYAVQPFS